MRRVTKCHEERAVSAGTVAHAKVIMDRGRWAAPLWDMVRSDHAGGLPGWTDGADEGRGGAAQAKRTATRAAGRPNKGPAGYPEVGCATVSFYDCEGQRLSTLRVGRIPQAKKATLKEMLSAEVTAALEQRPDLRLIKLADAAHDNWPNLAELAPPAHSSTDLVDFFHAPEQLKATTDAASGENNLRGRAQYEKYRHLVRNEPGGVEPVIRGLRYLHAQCSCETRI